MSLQEFLDDARAAYTQHRHKAHQKIGHCECPACGGVQRPNHQCAECIRLASKIDLIARTIKRRNG